MRIIVTGVLILAGGKGDRIGGNKALLTLGGRSLVQHVVEVAEQFSDQVVVVVGENQHIGRLSKQLPAHVQLVRDASKDQGPLMAIFSGLRHITSEYAVVLPCDSPFVNAKVMVSLIRSAEGFDAVIPLWPNGYTEPLHSVYRTQPTAHAAGEALRLGRLRVRDLLDSLRNPRYLPVDELRPYDPDLLTFFNINGQRDLRLAEAIIARRRDVKQDAQA